MDVCGLACLIAAMIFSEYSENLLDKNQLLDNLSWVTEFDKYDVFVRKYFICSFMKNCIHFSLLYPKRGELNSVICNLDARTDELHLDNTREPTLNSIHDLPSQYDDNEKVSVEMDVEYQPENIDCDDTEGYSNEDEVGEISIADIKNSVDETFKVGKKFYTYLELRRH